MSQTRGEIEEWCPKELLRFYMQEKLRSLKNVEMLLSVELNDSPLTQANLITTRSYIEMTLVVSLSTNVS